jgi:hypothetical protein
VVYEGRDQADGPVKARYAKKTDARTLAEVIERRRRLPRPVGRGVLKPAMVAKMAPNPLILALANPTPEIMPEEVKRRAPTPSSPPAVRTTRTRSTTCCASPSSSAARWTSARPPSTRR